MQHRSLRKPRSSGDRKHPRMSRRAGLSLLEVLIATTIFASSMIALTQLLSVGRRAAVSSRLDSEAVVRCEGTMAELVSGSLPLENVMQQPFADGDPDWVYSVSVSPTSSSDLLQLEVTVYHLLKTRDPNAAVTLTRQMRDPQVFLDAALAASATDE